MAKHKLIGTILVADDEEDYRAAVKAILKENGHTVHTANDGSDAINMFQRLAFDVVLLDVRMPRIEGTEVLQFVKGQGLDTEVIMLSGVSDVRIAVECMKNGAFYYITKPYSADELVSLIQRALEKKHLAMENKAMRSEISRKLPSGKIIGESPKFVKVLELASKVAPTDSTVLIQGSSGTGKELIANFLHQNSTRKAYPFVALNCASVPETLIESEFFGHEKGAFTDAIAMKQGLVEIANKGTLFLDEIGEISSVFQPKLLRFIQTGEYRRVGGNTTFHSDVRIVSATNKNLLDEVQAGRFREDLLYRLNVITLTLPTLVERKSDIPLLVETILQKKCGTNRTVTVSPEAIEELLNYSWPGNIRELENVLERALIVAADGIIHANDLVLPRALVKAVDSSSGNSMIGSSVSLDQLEHEHILGVLSNLQWNKNLAAKVLGISLKTLYTKIQKYQLTEP